MTSIEKACIFVGHYILNVSSLKKSTMSTATATATQQPTITSAPANKGREGWQQKTIFDLPDYRWQISTHKSNRGICTYVQRTDAGEYYSYMTFSDPSVRLVWDRGAKCTQKTVEALHAEGVKIFVEKVLPNLPTTYAEGEALQKQVCVVR